MTDDDCRPTEKACTKCLRIQALSEFSKAIGGKFDLSSRCRVCDRAYYLANREKVIARATARNERLACIKREKKADEKQARLHAATKVCSKCCAEKSKQDFKKDKSRPDRLHNFCQDCCNRVHREYRQSNPEAAAGWSKKWATANKSKTDAKRKRWNERNPGREAERHRVWRENNPERYAANKRAYSERISVRIHRAVRSRLVSWVKTGRGRTFETLGYSVSDLMQHLQKQFVKGMSWRNYGAWHMDHIVPLSSFKVEDRSDPLVRAAWALSNLRPLWAVDNLKKQAKRTHLI